MMGSGFTWPFMFIVPLAFIALIALGIYTLLSQEQRQDSSARYTENRALQLLKERYARGEITFEQYAKTKQDLES